MERTTLMDKEDFGLRVRAIQVELERLLTSLEVLKGSNKDVEKVANALAYGLARAGFKRSLNLIW